ncbi:MAG: hypothetical protein M3414_09420 [Pseudomonadota bacterium]|nr:hypothetical protein [Pseudomonadota bacterium]
MTLTASTRIADSATEACAASAGQAAEAGLVYVSNSVAGITRKRRGEGFDYFAPDSSAITNETVLQPVRGLAVPPAYTDVWICRNPRGHLQATGRDARGRKQYRYHAQWSSVRGDGKFERIVDFEYRKFKRPFRAVCAVAGGGTSVGLARFGLARFGRGWGVIAERLGGLMGVRQRRSR